MPKAIIYYENWVLKKEGVNKWLMYWACIRGNWLQFYERQSDQDRPELRKTLELTQATKCSLVKRNKHRLPFSIDNGMGVYYLKCETELDRYHWIFSILSAATGKSKRDLPDVVPPSMIEREAFRKLTKVEKQEEKIRNNTPDKPPKEQKNAADVKNKRRRKFAVRQENKMKRKEATRLKNLGLEPAPSSEDLSDSESTSIQFESREEKLMCKRYVNNIEFLKKAKKNTTLYQNTAHQPDEETTVQMFTEPKQYHTRPKTAGATTYTSKIKTDRNPPQQQRPSTAKSASRNNNEHLVTALMHTPSMKDDYQNKGYIGDENIEELPTINVLPNMVFTEFFDSDPESDNTEEVSLNSQNGIFLSLSSNELDKAGGAPNNAGSRRGSAVKASHTTISDDGDFQQVDFTGRVLSSPEISKNRRSRSSSPKFLTNPFSPGNLIELASQSVPKNHQPQPSSPANVLTNPFSPGNLIDLPISPVPTRSISSQSVPRNHRSRPSSPANFLTNPFSTGNLIEQPISPVPSRPITPQKVKGRPRSPVVSLMSGSIMQANNQSTTFTDSSTV